MAYEWTVFATLATMLVAVIGLLATALFQQGSKLDRLVGQSGTIDRLGDRLDHLSDRIDQRFEQVDRLFEQVDQRFEQVNQRFEQVDRRFEQVDRRFDRLEQRMREDKAELLARLDVLAERITRLEAS